MIRHAALFVLLMSGCASTPSFDGVDASSGRTVDLVPAPLRRGQSFTGAYVSPQAGDLHLMQYGDRIEGSYEDFWCGCRLQGSLIGKVDGNLARFDFEERYSACASSRTLRGAGFLFYRQLPGTDSEPQLYGARTYQPPRPNGNPRALPPAAISSVMTARGAHGIQAPALDHCP